MKLGILTYHRSHNYGAYMQSLALASAIRECIDLDVEIIDYNSKISEHYYVKEIFRGKSARECIFNLRKYHMFKREVRKLPLSKRKLFSNRISDFKNCYYQNYDIIVVGSDEVWKMDGKRGFPNNYWLPFNDNTIKMSYAASSRNDFDTINVENRNRITELLKSFSFVSVRDEITKDLIEKASNKLIVPKVVCDPTMAYDFKYNKEEGKSLIKQKYNINDKKRTLGIMVSDRNIAKYVTEKYGKDYNIISLFNYCEDAENNPTINPIEWGKIIGGLDGIITTYFHGMCFAINGNVPFLIIEKRKIKEARYSKSYDFLHRNQLETQYIHDSSTDVLRERIDEFMNSEIQKKCNYHTIKKVEQESFEIFISALEKLIAGG